LLRDTLAIKSDKVLDKKQGRKVFFTTETQSHGEEQPLFSYDRDGIMNFSFGLWFEVLSELIEALILRLKKGFDLGSLRVSVPPW
jgi:hypothetical protein